MKTLATKNKIILLCAYKINNKHLYSAKIDNTNKRQPRSTLIKNFVKQTAEKVALRAVNVARIQNKKSTTTIKITTNTNLKTGSDLARAGVNLCMQNVLYYIHTQTIYSSVYVCILMHLYT